MSRKLWLFLNLILLGVIVAGLLLVGFLGYSILNTSVLSQVTTSIPDQQHAIPVSANQSLETLATAPVKPTSTLAFGILSTEGVVVVSYDLIPIDPIMKILVSGPSTSDSIPSGVKFTWLDPSKEVQMCTVVQPPCPSGDSYAKTGVGYAFNWSQNPPHPALDSYCTPSGKVALPWNGTITSKYTYNEADLSEEYEAWKVTSSGNTIIASCQREDAGIDRVVMGHLAYGKFDALQVGMSFTSGDPIADIGSTGNSTGPHIHLAYLSCDSLGQNCSYLNPINVAGLMGTRP